MPLLQEKLKAILPAQVEDIKEFVKQHGEDVVGSVTLGQVFGGMRGIKGLVCDTSEVPADKGLIIRNIPIAELTEKKPEEIFYLLVTGELPNAEELADLQADIKSREEVPAYVWNVIDAMPADSHPMTMLNSAILVMQHESKFAKKYNEGMKKSEYWEYTLEDALDIIARVPAVAAYVYRKRYNKGPRIESDKNADWSTNYVKMLGLEDGKGEFADVMRVYLTCLSDHEGGNVSSFTASTIGSALSDLYYTLSGGLNGLAGPLHGLAVQECLKWVLELMEDFNGVPSKEALEKFTWDTLNAGKVVPGYGHAVLRVVDPRFTAFLEAGKKYCSEDPVWQTVNNVFEVVPSVLKQIPKISNPWPNVDASSGVLFYHYGLTEFDYYTVVFSVSRTLGIAAQSIMARAYGLPITRPKSMPTAAYKKALNA
jgi:citrate synthase